MRTWDCCQLLLPASLDGADDSLERVEGVYHAHVGEGERASDDGYPSQHVRDKCEVGDHQDTLYSGDDLGDDVGVERRRGVG